MKMAVKTVERGSAGRRRCRRRGELLPRRRQAWGAPPLSLPPSWLLGSPPPWRWDPWGRQKRGFWWLEIRGWRSPPRVRFSPCIYLLGFPSPPFRVSPYWAYRPHPNSDWGCSRAENLRMEICDNFLNSRISI